MPTTATPRDLREWQQRVMKITTSNEEFYRFFHQATDDMAALRLPIDPGEGPRKATTRAGATTWRSCPPPACRGSWPRSAATA